MTTTALTATASPFAIFRKRNFTLLWTGQLVSTIGSSLTSLAASILVYRLTNSAASVGLMLMATAAPSLVLGLFAGVFVDRFDRKRIMVATDLVRALVVLVIPFLVAQNILWLYLLVMIEASVTTFFDPAHSSVLPETATDQELAAANSMMAISSFGATAVGFAASGLIASAFPIEWAFYADAATFVFSAVCIALLRLPKIKAEGKTTITTVFRNMKSGFGFLFRTPILRSIYILSPLISLSFGLWNSLLLPFARQVLHATEFEYGLQEGLTSVGFVIGSLVMARISSRLREGQWLVIAYFGIGIVCAFYSMLSSIGIAIGIVMVCGFLNAPAGIARSIIIQRNTPREMRGRVASVFFVTRDVAFLVGMASAGLADLWGPRVLMMSAGILVLVPGALALVLPGLGQPAAEWRRMVGLLRAAAPAKMGGGRPATLADFDLLVGKVPTLSALPKKDRRELMRQSCVFAVPAGETIVDCGDKSDEVYFILSGRAIAGIEERGRYRSLETMEPGDFFGEIAALMGTPRTANVVADDTTTLLQMPATAFRTMIQNPQVSQLVHAKFFERMSRTNIGELPRFATLDQQALKELRQASHSA